jgi:selenocysteine lyase/cysteine desulfurase
MISIKLNTIAPEKLQKILFEKYKVEVPIMSQEKDVYLRYSIQVFNNKEDLDTLFNALEEIKKEGILIK